MQQYPPLQDKDVIPEGTPPAGVKYKPVTGKMYNDALSQMTGSIQAAPDISGWGPEATRRLYNQAKDDANANFEAAMKARDMKLAGKSGPALNAQLALITNPYMKAIIEGGSITPANSAEIEMQLKEKRKAMTDNALKVVKPELAAIKAPAIISPEANNAFAQTSSDAGGFIPEKSNNADYKYADVKTRIVNQTAMDLLAGKRDEVAGTIKSWGGNSLYAMLSEYRDNLWPKDVDRAKQAMSSIGTPEFAAQLKNIQSPELKALVEKESQVASKAQEKNSGKIPPSVITDINYDFDNQKQQIYGKGIEVYNKATDVYQAREADFYKQQQAKPATAPSAAATESPAVSAASKAPAAVSGDIEQAALTLARGARGSTPDLSKWNSDKRESLRGIYSDQINADVASAKTTARFLTGPDDPRINEIANPVLKKIVSDDLKAGRRDDIGKDLDAERTERNNFANSAITNGYAASPGFSQPVQQKLASTGGVRP